MQRSYAAALLIVAAPDGLSTEERSYFEAWQKACGHPADLVEEMRRFDPATADVDAALGVLVVHADDTSAVVDGATEVLKRGLVDDAIKVAASDGGYSAAERTRLREVVARIGVDADLVTALEGAVDIENAVRRARLALLQYPDR